MDGDLKVEHINKMFKAGLLNLAGNYNQENLRRVALTMDLSENLEDKLYPNYVERYLLNHLLNIVSKIFQIFSEEPVFKMHLGHRNADWSDQVKKGVLDMKASSMKYPAHFRKLYYRNKRCSTTVLEERFRVTRNLYN